MSGLKFTGFFFFLVLFSFEMNSQYFGRNKVNYESFDFKIFETPHFQIYNYITDSTKLNNIGELSERWYLRHQVIFRDTLERRNPVVLYNNHADFQQTTVIQSLIGVGTGGVTEGIRNRVVMPVMLSNNETNHVLGHELVHVFQYNMFKTSDTTNLESVGNVPLWMIEGLAEYMSIGSNDVQTAMWMRDAVATDDVPTLQDMTRRPDKYFPYRYGHAFWSYVTGRWSDAVIRPLLLMSGSFGYERAIDTLLSVDPDTLSDMWKRDLVATYAPYRQKTKKPAGENIFSTRNFGKLNIGPSVSPDGKYMVFISDRDVISIDMYLANLKKNKVVRQLTRLIRDSHIDEYSYIESTGSWSPDGKQYVLTSFIEGRTKLLIFNLNKRKVTQTIGIDELPYFQNPAWSPDGKYIAMSGLKEGVSDLYLYHIETKKLTRLTNDLYSDMQPVWSPDGSKLAFISDRGSTNPEQIIYGYSTICEYDMQDGHITIYNLFSGVDHSNPQYSPDGRSVYFLSAPEGIQNIYEFNMTEDNLYQLTDLYTGVSGISELSPAFSVAANENVVVYIMYENDGYSLFKADINDFDRVPVDPGMHDMTAAELAPVESKHVVDMNLDRYPVVADTVDFDTKPYKPKFSLEYIGSSGVGVGVGRTGTALAGGVSFLFSDMLKRNQFITSVSVNGEIYDIGGQAVYINQGNRINWGASLSHIPYRSSFGFVTTDSINDLPVYNLVLLNRRIFQEEAGIFAQYPLSKKVRFEGGISGSYYSYRLDSINNYYTPGGIFIEEDRNKIDGPDPFSLFRAYVAYVGDNSSFGLTSPLRGYRYHFEVERTLGEINFWGIIADYRKYFFLKPFGFGLRGMTYTRIGPDADELYPFFLGYPYYVRGYGYNAITQNRCIDGSCINIDRISGSKMVVLNAEIRYPLIGVKRLALIKSGIFFADLVLFGDGGLSWYDEDNVAFEWDPAESTSHIPIFSTGVSLRVNLFGAVIVEPYFAVPFQRPEVDIGQLGIFLSAGGW